MKETKHYKDGSILGLYRGDKFFLEIDLFSLFHLSLDDVRDYFGETIALYFAFLGFYTKFLIPICLVALFHKLFVNDDQKEENAWFAALNLIWTTIFLEIWKRRCCTISFEWGTLSRDKGKSYFAIICFMDVSFYLFSVFYFFRVLCVCVAFSIVMHLIDINFMLNLQIWTASVSLIEINETLEFAWFLMIFAL